ncbi:MAG: endonuclease/exonuclease/phosphatase family protein [Rubrobacteraceae bacterium]
MSFNIRGARRGDGENIWSRRARLNAEMIRRYAPDVVGFQEFQEENGRFYRRNLPEYERVLGPKYENRRPHAFNAIYWNPVRLNLLDTGGFWLSESPEKFSRSWETAQARSANWARFRTSSTGVEFTHLNTHLDHKSVDARRQGAKLIVRRLEELVDENLPVLITGDFNADPGSPVHQIFTEAGFGDAHLLAGNPPTRTFHKFQGEEFVSRKPEKEGRLDWILVRGFSPETSAAYTSCRVVYEAEPPIYPSDHYPVVAKLFL